MPSETNHPLDGLGFQEAQRGMKKGDLSKFIEDAVKWRVLDQTMAEARGKFADLRPQALDRLLNEAITAARPRT